MRLQRDRSKEDFRPVVIPDDGKMWGLSKTQFIVLLSLLTGVAILLASVALTLFARQQSNQIATNKAALAFICTNHRAIVNLDRAAIALVTHSIEIDKKRGDAEAVSADRAFLTAFLGELKSVQEDNPCKELLR
jgi:hypothetical protein